MDTSYSRVLSAFCKSFSNLLLESWKVLDVLCARERPSEDGERTGLAPILPAKVIGTAS